jgi:hypothetical protein
VALARLHHQHHPVSDIEHKIVRLSFPLCSKYRKLASLTWCRLVVERLNKGITDLKETGEKSACSLGLSATSQQYFSLRTNQPPATSRNQPAVLFSQNKPAPAISHQPTEQPLFCNCMYTK